MQVFECQESIVKRDMDLIRDILLKLDGDERLHGMIWVRFETPEELGLKNHSVEEVAYHLHMLIEEGFVKGDLKLSKIMPLINKITWKGHELIDDIRDDTIWGKTKERTKNLSSVGIALIWEIAKAEIRQKLGLP
jgi:hypothetical protein